MGENDVNELGQPVGVVVPNWSPRPRPAREAMQGRFCRLEPVDVATHGRALFDANRLDSEGGMWTYMAYGPFATFDEYRSWLEASAQSEDPLFFAIVDGTSGKAAGLASFLRINPASGSIEVGHLAYSPLLQRTAAATEAMFLMMQRAFELGYRRYEWKCNALNAPSRAAALRLGFQYEGTFRQAEVHKGRTRDSAWFSIIDKEWPALRDAFMRWLDPDNFDAQGRQKTALSALTAAAHKDGPARVFT